MNFLRIITCLILSIINIILVYSKEINIENIHYATLLNEIILEEDASEFDIDEYLNLVFELDDYYQMNDDIYNSTNLLENAIFTVNEKSLEQKSLNKVTLFNRLGRNSMQLQDYNDAIYYLLTAKFLCDAVYNERGVIYISLLNNIAHAYLQNGNILFAKIYIDEMMDCYNVYENIYNNYNEYTFECLLNYGQIYYKVGDHKIAETIFKHIIDNSTPDSEVLYLTYDSYISLLINDNRIDECMEYLQILRENTTYSRSIDHINNMIMAYIALKKNDMALNSLMDYNSRSIENALSVMTNFSQSHWESYWRNEALKIMGINNYVAYRLQENRALIIGCNMNVLCKSLCVQFSSMISQHIATLDDASLRQTLKEYKYRRNVLSMQDSEFALNNVPFMRDLWDKEDSILHAIPNLTDSLISNSLNYKRVSDALDKDELAIDFCYILLENKLYYGAYLLKKDDVPVFILLSEYDQINELISKMETDEILMNEKYSAKDYKLFDLIWKNIIPYLDGVRNIYFSPINILSNINHSLIHNETGRALGDKYNLIRISSFYELSRVKSSQNIKYKSSVIYGNIDYGLSTDVMTEESRKYGNVKNLALNDIRRSFLNGDKWYNLPAVKYEVDNLCNQFSKYNISYKLFERNKAIEESFKSLDEESPDIIHIATHGFSFQPNDAGQFVKTKSEYTINEGYMNLSGLLFAGANNMVKGNFSLNGIEDGILTSEEISRLNLSNTKLIVLSACVTGKGVNDAIYGTLGLQQAFKRAGVESIVMSLWNVPDDATALLMTFFYEQLLSGKNRRDALKIAVEQVRLKYPDPYYWGAWVVLD